MLPARRLERLAVLAVVASLLGCSPGAGANGDAGDAGSRTSDGGDASAKDGGKDGSLLPYLTAFSLAPPEGGTGPALTLVPPFSPSIHDYYVRCAAGTNAVTVSITASPGAKSLLVEPTPSGAVAMQTVSLSVTENQAIVAAATDGVATTEYWVRCLPYDFPAIRMIVHAEAGAPAPAGYYLVGTSQPVGARWGYAIVLDGNGVPVWYAAGSSGLGVEDVDNVVDGAVSFAPSSTFPFEVHYLNPPMTTTANPSGQEINTHELQVLKSNGHYLTISVPVTSGIDLTGMSLPLGDGGALPLGPNSFILDCEIVEFDSTGSVVWTWLASDHFDPVKDTTAPTVNCCRMGPDGGPAIEAFHCNSIDVDPVNGNLLISSRDMDSLFYIDRSSPTGAVLWKLGGQPYSKDDAAYVPTSSPFLRQHDARFQPGWSPSCNGGTGQISIFDDESPGLSGQPQPPVDAGARAVVLDVVVGVGDGGTVADCGTVGRSTPGASVAWEYEGKVTSAIRGSFRVLADGSRLIGWGSGAPDLVFTEVDIQKNDLRDFYFTDGDVSYRAVKVPLQAFNLDVLRATAGLPYTLPMDP